MSEEILIRIIIFVLGACIGSFLNVCIYRMPLGRSVVKPRSHCAACGVSIPWMHNIPILSWFILRGKAACCGTPIDARYPLVEALTALGFLGLWVVYPLSTASVYMLFLSGLIVATFIDIDHFIIPDEISLGGCLVGLLLSALIPSIHGAMTWWGGLKQGLLGLLIGGGLLLGIAVFGAICLRKEALGMGDIKLMAAMGAFLGWEAPLFILGAASVIGSFFGIFILFQKGKMWGVRIPFGPYLTVAAIVWLFGGKIWMHEYMQYVQNI
jgi:leader peptidase (prepilin peptidase)/N-methyltransferase